MKPLVTKVPIAVQRRLLANVPARSGGRMAPMPVVPGAATSRPERSHRGQCRGSGISGEPRPATRTTASNPDAARLVSPELALVDPELRRATIERNEDLPAARGTQPRNHREPVAAPAAVLTPRRRRGRAATVAILVLASFLIGQASGKPEAGPVLLDDETATAVTARAEVQTYEPLITTTVRRPEAGIGGRPTAAPRPKMAAARPSASARPTTAAEPQTPPRRLPRARGSAMGAVKESTRRTAPKAPKPARPSAPPAAASERRKAAVRQAPGLSWTSPTPYPFYRVIVWRDSKKVLELLSSRSRATLPLEWYDNGVLNRLVPGRYAWVVYGVASGEGGEEDVGPLARGRFTLER